MKKYALMLISCASLFLSGCIYFGSHNLPPDRIRYNKSVISSDLQQTLLNLVRLRYGDMPNFLSLNNIVSQYTVDSSISGDISRTWTPRLGITNYGFLSATGSISETPTITYTPLQGEEFVQRLMTPVDIRIAQLFLRDGWSIGRVFRTLFQKLGPMPNALVASRPNSHRVPRYEAFSQFTRILRKLQIHEIINVSTDNVGDVYRIRFDIVGLKCLTPQELCFLKKHVGVTPENPTFWVTTSANYAKKPRHLLAETRTMLSIYSYLSKGVEIPPEHTEIAGMVKLPNGQIFDWNLVVGGLLDIKYCRTYPKNAYIYVYYRGYYFYVEDTDRHSKEGLDLLMILNGVFQGNVQSVLPVFTIS